MNYEDVVAVYPDFPKKGISFKDISTMVSNPEAFHSVIDDMSKMAEKYGAEAIMGSESRGFIFGAAMAYKMNKGLIMARKAGKLPGKTISASYALEYGTATLEIPEGQIKPGQKVVLVDDLIATGGTFEAMKELVIKAGGIPVAAIAFIRLYELEGEKNVGIPCEWVLNLSDSH